MRRTRFGRAAIVALLVALTALAAIAQAADRPAGWGEASHSNDAALDYATVFPTDEVNEILITIAPEDWAAMQANMVELAGEPGGGDVGPGGAGGPPLGPPPLGERPEGAPVEGVRPTPGGDFLDENPMWVEATIAFDGLEWTHVGVRYKGNSTLRTAWQAGSSKLPFKFDFDEFEDAYPEVKNQRFFGFKQLSLSNAVADASFLRDATAYDLLEAAGLVAPAHAFYRLTLDHGEGPVDLGLYVVMEVVDDTVIEQAFDGDDGNIYEGDGVAASFAAGTRDQLAASFQKENNDDEPSWADLEALYDALHADTRTRDAAAWRAGLASVFDVGTFLDWLALEGMMQNWDAYGAIAHNFYLYADPATGQLTWIAWDHDRTFSNGDAPGAPPVGAIAGAPGGAPVRQGGPSTTVTLDRDDVGADWPLIRFLLDDPVYAADYAARVAALAADVFDADAILARTDAYVALIRPYAEAEAGAEAFDAAVATLRARVLEADAAADAFVARQAD